MDINRNHLIIEIDNSVSTLLNLPNGGTGTALIPSKTVPESTNTLKMAKVFLQILGLFLEFAPMIRTNHGPVRKKNNQLLSLSLFQGSFPRHFKH